MKRSINKQAALKKQTGAALLVIMLVLALTIASVLMAGIDRESRTVKNDKKIIQLLARASEAVKGYKIRVGGACNGFPCADTDSDGESDTLSIGELPWKTVGIKPLRDSYGLPFDYVVIDSATFQINEKPVP
ncbi:MAG: hypothetical protein COB62_03195 [Piscirickettsiaceae bacterium]|nr:MAG: hypothetical protein COB62_03195 [Piscirickettsiaceae bacterium]